MQLLNVDMFEAWLLLKRQLEEQEGYEAPEHQDAQSAYINEPESNFWKQPN